MKELVIGLFVPLLGTVLGSACVFFMQKQFNKTVERILIGFASGVMLAASIWSLIMPSIEQMEHWGKWSFVPAVVGIWLGVLFLLFLDENVPHLHFNEDQPEGRKSKLGKTEMMVIAVTLHNIPEGMAVGAVFAGMLQNHSMITTFGALALAIGIAIQNFPEGAIISMPLRAQGLSKGKAFFYGFISGAVEPIAAIITILFARMVVPGLPYFLSFAAGAMIYVVVEELIPEMSEPPHSNVGTIALTAGFTIMMILDIALG